ncbi:hypothetical protein H1Z61_00855 [Bacillus aquiflavi]|uniref:Uncharacterized protein n=1 Tax=Bacillus aquiflavi TaxID=2672567 RepID=A0A6B3VWD6_9BACI|nr:hypothetical protein [Bacillus aquiflavi]MBA4535717.1 hypothetical protein [Bacillus aquiflavi]NEY80093.1 hypothetical protein [Bacillus aquiflavi]UAC49017.1 hypothetical protein K6959_03685 [Bacillus aquiflavi]
MEQSKVASFVVRVQLTETEKNEIIKRWRIKVTHVQEDVETIYETFEDVMSMMKKTVEDL